MQTLFNRDFGTVNELCEDATQPELRFNPCGAPDPQMLREFDTKDIGPVKGGLTRE